MQEQIIKLNPSFKNLLHNTDYLAQIIILSSLWLIMFIGFLLPFFDITEIKSINLDLVGERNLRHLFIIIGTSVFFSIIALLTYTRYQGMCNTIILTDTNLILKLNRQCLNFPYSSIKNAAVEKSFWFFRIFGMKRIIYLKLNKPLIKRDARHTYRLYAIFITSEFGLENSSASIDQLCLLINQRLDKSLAL